jgi:hypothetical protein
MVTKTTVTSILCLTLSMDFLSRTCLPALADLTCIGGRGTLKGGSEGVRRSPYIHETSLGIELEDRGGIRRRDKNDPYSIGERCGE